MDLLDFPSGFSGLFEITAIWRDSRPPLWTVMLLDLCQTPHVWERCHTWPDSASAWATIRTHWIEIQVWLVSLVVPSCMFTHMFDLGVIPSYVFTRAGNQVMCLLDDVCLHNLCVYSNCMFTNTFLLELGIKLYYVVHVYHNVLIIQICSDA